MNAEIKDQWTAALRSGDYKQGKDTLHNVDTNTYCCLGVLCDLAVKAGIIPPPVVIEGRIFSTGEAYNQHKYGVGPYEGDVDPHYLPNDVQKWAGLSRKEGGVIEVELPLAKERLTLPAANDAGIPFIKIAQAIEKEL